MLVALTGQSCPVAVALVSGCPCASGALDGVTWSKQQAVLPAWPQCRPGQTPQSLI